MERPHKLTRVKSGQIIVGVCSGLAAYFQVDPVIVRAAFIALVFAGGSGIIIYFILALIMPDETVTTTPHSPKPEEKTSESVKEFVSQIKSNAEELAQDINTRKYSFERFQNLFGFLLIIFGAAALFSAVTGVNLLRWELIWPVVLIFLGSIIIFKKS